MFTNPETPSADAAQRPPSIDKGPLRPAPTQAYDFKNHSPQPLVFYIRTLEQAKAVLAFPQPGPFGFDLEWRPTFQKGAPENPVALVQLANHHSVMLFQVSGMSEFPLPLKRILESPETVKAGVGIQGDAKKLFRDCNVSMSNCVDLSLLARTVDNERWAGPYNSPIGLARLIECYEYRLLLKGKISRSDWTAALNLKQQEYAGNDAHAGYSLYKKFQALVSQMPSQPKSAWYSFNVCKGSLCDNEGVLWKAENPDYDPGPLPEPRPPTERKEQSESHSSQVEIGVMPLQRILPPVSAGRLQIPQGLPIPGRLIAAKQAATRINSQDRFHSTLASRSMPSRIISQGNEGSYPRRKNNCLPLPGGNIGPSVTHNP